MYRCPGPGWCRRTLITDPADRGRLASTRRIRTVATRAPSSQGLRDLRRVDQRDHDVYAARVVDQVPGDRREPVRVAVGQPARQVCGSGHQLSPPVAPQCTAMMSAVSCSAVSGGREYTEPFRSQLPQRKYTVRPLRYSVVRTISIACPVIV